MPKAREIKLFLNAVKPAMCRDKTGTTLKQYSIYIDWANQRYLLVATDGFRMHLAGNMSASDVNPNRYVSGGSDTYNGQTNQRLRFYPRI